MSLDVSKLERVRVQGGKLISRCPACAAGGGDTSGEHLFVNMESGEFGCVMFQGDEGKAHRSEIHKLAGLPDAKPSRADASKWTAMPHAPAEAPFPSLRHYKHGLPVAHWTYHTAAGLTAGIVARFNLPGGRKETLPLAWCRDQHGATKWHWKSMPDPRPLYGLPLADGPVVIVEGEKCAEAVRATGMVATTWAGGSSAIHKSDWSPLAGRDVVIWPDNDAPGRRACASLVAILTPTATSIRVVSIPDDAPDGWDAADTTPEQILAIIIGAGEIRDEPPEPMDYFEAAEVHDAPDRLHDMPFRLLGSDDGMLCYLPDNGQEVVRLSPSSHTKLNFMQLAPLQVWEAVFPGKPSTNWDAAANALIQASQSLPKFDPRAIRGRGCWIDGNDVVYHAGDKLAVNGAIRSLHAYTSPTRAIYEGGYPIAIDTADAARNVESASLITLCEMLPWDHPMSGKLFAGWMALAPICGALSWRPHGWVTGASGSGKSWVISNIVSPLIGKTAIYVQGNTSEAGIRGSLGCDAMPVLFDEAESENQRAGMRIDGVLELARQASSENGAGIVKGTKTGGSITYMVRSMFCFASIGVAAVKKADTSRISVMGLRKTNDAAQFERVKKLWRETTADPAFCARIRARSVRNAITIRHNAEIFCHAAAEFTGDKRSADQIGTLLAGAYSLTSTKAITHEAAREWLAKQDWSAFKVDAVDSDENQCLAHLFASPIRLEHTKGPETLTIDEAIQRARAELTPGVEGLALLRIGIKVEYDAITVANQHQGLERVFRDTPWAGAKWRGQLLRIENATTPKNPVRFGPMVLQRAVRVPIVD